MNRFDDLRDALGPPKGDALGKVLARVRRRRVARRSVAALIALAGIVAIAVSADAVMRRPNSVHIVSPDSTVPTPTIPTTFATNTTATTRATTASTQPARGNGLWSGLQLTITQQSLGRVRVGMTLDQAQTAAGVVFDGMGDGAVYPRTLPAGYPHLYVGEGPNHTVVCVGAEIAYSSATPQTVATRDGLHLGDSAQQLLTIYGGRARYVPKPATGISPAAGYVVTEADGNLAFSVYNSRVVGIKGGAHDVTPSSCTG